MMPQPFTLDTSGTVYLSPETLSVGRTWPDLDPFTQGYVEALLRALVIDDADIIEASERTGVSLLPRFSDLSPEALAMILADCAAFQGAPEWLQTFDALDMDDADAGGAFWVTRQGAPSFEGRYSEDLNALARTFPPPTVTLGDDGKVRLHA